MSKMRLVINIIVRSRGMASLLVWIVGVISITKDDTRGRRSRGGVMGRYPYQRE